MIKKILLIAFAINIPMFPQLVKLGEQTKINSDKLTQCFYPKFSSDDSQIIFTSVNYKGLYTYNINSKQTKIISEENGVGYRPLIVDNKIIFRSSKFIEGRKFHSVFSADINSNQIQTIESDKRRIAIPNQIIGNALKLIEDSSVNEKNIFVNQLSKANQSSQAIYSENNHLYLSQNKNVIDISPLGKGVYVWESFSHDGKKIIFSYGNKGTFICDLNGNILQNIKDARYAKFSPDDKYVLFMRDRDDGYKYISSDLFVYSLAEQKEFQLTNTPDKIEMYPEWSHDQKNIVYNTTEGSIYIAKIIFEN